MHRLPAILLFGALLAPLGCSDGSGPPPTPAVVRLGAPTLALDDGDSVRVTATVLDEDGEPLEPGSGAAAVVWSSSDAAVASVADGLIRGNRPGTARITARAGSAESSVEVTVRQVAAEVRVTGGDGQEARAGGALADTLAVRVLDRHGDGVGGVTVDFTVTAGGGSIAPTRSVTDAAGAARAEWTLGDEGVQSATATVAGLAAAAFTASIDTSLVALAIESIEPGTLEPGITATLTGSGFAAAAGGNVVTIAGTLAAVLTATPTRLTVRVPARSMLPCEPTRGVAVEVTAEGAIASRSHPLAVAVPRALAVGEAVAIDAAEVRCNEIPLGEGEYVLSVYNVSRSFQSGAALEARASTGSVSSVAASRAPARPSAARAANRRLPREVSALHAERSADHRRRLDASARLIGRFAPTLRRASGIRPSRARAPLPAVGDTLSFNIPYARAADLCAEYTPVRARAVYVGEYGVVFEDVAAPLAGQMDSLYRALGEEFDADMYPIIAENFGDPLVLDEITDDNGRFFMLFSKVVQDDGPGIAGFVVSGDFFPTAECEGSNLAEIFYARVPTDPTSDFDLPNTRETWMHDMRKTIIHEVKHITSFAEKLAAYLETGEYVGEEAWLEESTARMAEELWGRSVFGYEQDGNTGHRESIYCEVRPEWPECPISAYAMIGHFIELYEFGRSAGELTPLGRVGENDFSFYSSGWSLVRWAIDQGTVKESDFLSALTQTSAVSGIDNLEARAGLPFATLLGDWSIALAIDDQPGLTPASPRHDFPTWDLRDIYAGLSTDYPDFWEPGSPMLTRALPATGAATAVPRLRGGSAVVFSVAAGADGPRVVEIRGPDGIAPASTVRVTMVRVR